jgi:hypothetical protein
VILASRIIRSTGKSSSEAKHVTAAPKNGTSESLRSDLPAVT